MMYSVVQNLQQSVAKLTEELKKEKAEHQLTKNALQKSEARLRILTNQASLIIWEVDSKGIFTFVEGEKTIKSSDLIGKSIFELYKNHQEVLDKTHFALAGNEVKWFGEAEDIEYETRVIPQISESGKTAGLI
ncbi:MAG: hypothetical protein F6K48_34735, partial [Okeania sp. SIO3H1]|nr:hypothetical protein [Okeania sp. SIO3H1]